MATEQKIVLENIPCHYASIGTVYNAEIIPGKSIRIWGIEANHVRGPQTFDKTFTVGNEAEYDSYNLKYTGPIRSITVKNVSVFDNCHDKNARLPIERFIGRNWDFDAAKIAKHNAEESMCI